MRGIPCNQFGRDVSQRYCGACTHCLHLKLFLAVDLDQPTVIAERLAYSTIRHHLWLLGSALCLAQTSCPSRALNCNLKVLSPSKACDVRHTRLLFARSRAAMLSLQSALIPLRATVPYILASKRCNSTRAPVPLGVRAPNKWRKADLESSQSFSRWVISFQCSRTVKITFKQQNFQDFFGIESLPTDLASTDLPADFLSVQHYEDLPPSDQKGPLGWLLSALDAASTEKTEAEVDLFAMRLLEHLGFQLPGCRLRYRPSIPLEINGQT